jgi:ankyrin repeat protein
LEKGANVGQKVVGMNGLTPLHSAAVSGHLELVILFLDKGANVNERDSRGWAPLHFAATNGSVDVVRVLLDSGAEMQAKNVRRMTPLDVARAAIDEARKAVLDWAARENLSRTEYSEKFELLEQLEEVVKLL